MHKIAFNALGLKSKTGGVEAYIYNLIQHILDIDKINKYFLFIGENTENVFESLKHYSNLKIIVYPIDTNNSTVRVIAEHIILPLGLLKNGIKLVHHMCNYMPRISPVKSITTLHDLCGFFYNENFPPEKIMQRYYRYLKQEMGFTAKHAAKIITISNFTKGEFQRYYDVPDNKLKIVGLSLDSRKETFSPNEADLLQYDIKKPYLLSVSVVRPHKNYAFLVKSFDMLKEKYKVPHQLVIAGGIQVKADDFFEAIKQSPYKDDIKYLGYVPNQNLASLYNFADIYVCPSLYEGFGIPLMEAMQYKLPIASSSSASLPEVGGDGCLYFDPYNIEDACDKIYSLIKDQDLRESIVEKQKDRLEYFKWSDVAKEILDLYEELI